MGTRTFKHRQKPQIEPLASSPMQYRAALLGKDGDSFVEVSGALMLTEDGAVASAWAAILAWSGEKPVGYVAPSTLLRSLQTETAIVEYLHNFHSSEERADTVRAALVELGFPNQSYRGWDERETLDYFLRMEAMLLAHVAAADHQDMIRMSIAITWARAWVRRERGSV
jgi:hypothetical protein